MARFNCTGKASISGLVWLVSLFSAGPAVYAEPANTTTVSFEIRWPLMPQNTNAPALLTGVLGIWLTNTEQGLLKLELTITRPPTETHRQFWNKTLAFPQYDWMRYVRVWDTNHQWLWPNLPFLLRLYGRERIDRYGGWDPGKDVDNDFAAVLIRKYYATGERESSETESRPLVSAEWHPVSTKGMDRQAIVHSARSDQFTLHLDDKAGTQSGRILVWLIYADFMGAPVPRDWPKKPEHDGGILAFFEIRWDYREGHGYSVVAKQKPPPGNTGFDWRRWVARYSIMDRAQGACRLSEP